MQNFDPNKSLIFIHVPKSGGRSVAEVAKAWFPGQFRPHYYNEQAAQMPPKHDLRALEAAGTPPVIYGHFNKLRGFGVEQYYPDVDQFMTVLRDPLELMISNYFYVRKVAAGWQDQSRVPRGDLKDSIARDPVNMLNHFPRDVTLENYKDIIETYFVEVGLTEFLPESLRRMAEKTGKSFDPNSLEHRNATERDETVPDDIRDVFREAHPLEYAVYDYVRQRYESAGR